MLSQYNKYTESWRENDVENAPTEVLLESPSVMVNKISDQMSVVIITEENIDTYKIVAVVNLPLVRFISGPTKNGIRGNINGAWYPDISVAVVTALGVLVEEVLSDIGMNSSRSVIHL